MNDLFPSAKLIFEWVTAGTSDLYDDANTKSVYAGFSLSYPLGASQKKAKLEISNLELKKAKLTAKAKKSLLRSDLHMLFNKIEENKIMIKLIETKVSVAIRIYNEEKKNYRQGRSSINDLITAGINLEDYRFLALKIQINLNKLIIEWLRLTDELVKKTDENTTI